MANKVFSFFKKIGHACAGIFHLIDQLLPAEVLHRAVQYARDAADRFTDNASRRGYVMTHLIKDFHLPEHLAALAVELAVTQLKHAEELALAKVDEQITEDPPFVEREAPTTIGIVGPNTVTGEQPTTIPDDAPPADPTLPSVQPEPPAGGTAVGGTLGASRPPISSNVPLSDDDDPIL